MNKRTLITAVIVGIIASIAFILVQPLFGMATLTSRHAGAYIKLGEYGATSALIISWFVHISVSVFYAVISAVIFNINRSALVSIGQVLVLGWITTLTATPANEWVVKFVTSLQLPAFSSLSALNTSVGPKLWLHIMFFAFVVGGLWFANRKPSLKNPYSDKL